MTNVQQYYQILELEPGATLEEVNQGYKDLAMVWHPDRFSSHPRLQQKAQKKLQQINEAHEKLRSSLLISVTRHSHKNSERAQPRETPVQRQNCYQQAAHNAKTEQERKYNYEYVHFANFNCRDVQGWLD